MPAARSTALPVVLSILAACGPSDQTPPEIVSLTPEPGAKNVWVRDPITVQFTKPVALATPDIALRLTGKNGTVLGKTLSIDADGKAVHISFVASPEPGTVTAVVDPEQVRDSSEHHLTPLVAPWSWELPEFQQLGGHLNDAAATEPSPSMALDSSGYPVVAWTESVKVSELSVPSVFVKRWTGAGWERLGGALNIDPAKRADLPSLAIDASGTVHVAFRQVVGTADIQQIVVVRWSGTEWAPVGTTLNRNSGQNGRLPRLRFDSSNRAVVAWLELVPRSVSGMPTLTWNVYAIRREGTSWVSLGDELNLMPEHQANFLDLAIDGTGRPIIAWSESDGAFYRLYARRYSDMGWVLLGGTGAADAAISTPMVNVGSFRVAVQPGTDVPFVTWYEDIGATSTGTTPLYVRVKKLSTTIWTQVGSAALNIVSTRRAGSPIIAFTSDGAPLVAFDELLEGALIYAVFLKRLSAAGTWELIGTGSLNTVPDHSSHIPALAVDSGGTPWIAWAERRGDATINELDVFVRRQNR